ncbi:MAG: fasciclin domain-containing protein [Clostridiaceae bacterium]
MKKMIKKISLLLSIFLISVSFSAFASAPSKDIVDTAVGNSDFSILVSALQKAKLVDTLKGTGPFTVFAPTNAAFEKLLADLNITAAELLAQPDLAKVLTYHVVSGKVMSTDLKNGLEAATVNGEKIKFDLTSGAMVNKSKITTADLEATNGVIHVIDTVLVPTNFKLQEVKLDEDGVADTGIPATFPFLIPMLLTGGAALLVFRKKEA